VIAAVHGSAYGLALEALCAVGTRWAASDARFSLKEVYEGLTVDVDTLARADSTNASLLFELALARREFGAEEARLALSLMVLACGSYALHWSL
jgi:enoyl-CoA hydratase/carnithine racemase